MSLTQRSLNYLRANPVFTYIVGGVTLYYLRQASVNHHYTQNFAVYDVERKKELERFLASGGVPHNE